MHVSKQHSSHATSLARETDPRKRSAYRNPLLSIPIGKRLALGFLIPALIASIALGTIALQSQQLLVEGSTLYQNLVQGESSLNTAVNDLALTHIYVQGTFNDASQPHSASETIREDLNAVHASARQFKTILENYIQNDLLDRHGGLSILLTKAEQQRALAERVVQTWQSYDTVQEQLLSALSTRNLQGALVLEYPQVDLAYTASMGALLTLIQFNGGLAASIRDATVVEENTLLFVTVLSIFGVLLGIGIAGWLVSNTLVQRLHQLCRVFQSVEKGQLEARITVVGRDEITDVGTSVNSMLNTIERDITEREKMEQTLGESEERFRTVVTNAPIVLFALDANGIFTLSEGRGLQALGLRPGQLEGLPVFEVCSDFPQMLDQMRQGLAGESVAAMNQIGDVYFDTHLTPLFDKEHQPAGIIGVATDITERIQGEQKMLHQALHDTLTDLPNRIQLLEEIEQAILVAERAGSGVALLMMDLNRFKEVNDTFGHQHGDRLLQQVGERLCQVVKSSGTVARLGGDEFAILLPIADEMSVQRVAGTLLSALEEPFIIEEYPLHVDASIGVVLYPLHGTDGLTLLRLADVAMYTAKQAKEGYAFYDATSDQHNPHRIALLGALRHAIDNNELVLYYQPKGSFKTGAIHSVEALLRWQHPTLGFIPPDQFIPLAEQTGLITPLTRWVLETAICQCKDWLRAGLNLQVAVNLSVWNLREVALPETIVALLEHYKVPPALLRVEVTESAVMIDVDRALAVLTRISALGVSISVDDFGTGYSSLAYLKRLPVNELKIDRSFVQYMTKVEADVSIVRCIVTLAHSLGMRVVAEGVEDEATWDLLWGLECDMVQGYYLSRPLAAQKLILWLADAKEVVAL